jgi:hypothetical protein
MNTNETETGEEYKVLQMVWSDYQIFTTVQRTTVKPSYEVTSIKQ